MRLIPPLFMAQPPEDPFVVAGSGGVVLGEARTNHEGRHALLLIRGEEDTSEFEALVATMGILIVEKINQKGNSDPRSYFGKGRLQDVADERKSAIKEHPWGKVDLVLIHTNATPRQLVNISQTIGLELWDRVRLLLSLFTSHASSVEARTQVRIAQLQSDRTVLRELMHQQTTGERAGYGGGGVTALQNVLANVGRELANLRRRQTRQTNAQREHRRQRVRSGAVTVGLIGYTNAGKSSLFRLLSGKKVLVEDQLFSTLETTVGRMEDSPRVLLADTIGFIDNIPNATLSAFKATLAEALEADLTLVLADASDSPLELERKLLTTRREVFERLYGEPVDDEFPWNDAMDPYHHSMQVVLTKIDEADEHMLDEAHATVAGLGFPPALGISAHSGVGIDALKASILRHLFGSPSMVHVHPSMDNTGDAVERIVSDIYDQGMVTSNERDPNGTVSLTVWLTHAALEKLKARWNERIEVK